MLLEELRREADRLSQIRERAVLELHEAGASYGDIAAIANLSRARVAQIVRRAAERVTAP